MIINMNGAKAPETPSPVLQEKTVTPETLPVVIGADEGYDGLSQVTVNPDAQLKAENIRSGKTVFGVTGVFGGSASDSLLAKITSTKTLDKSDAFEGYEVHIDDYNELAFNNVVPMYQYYLARIKYLEIPSDNFKFEERCFERICSGFYTNGGYSTPKPVSIYFTGPNIPRASSYSQVIYCAIESFPTSYLTNVSTVIKQNAMKFILYGDTWEIPEGITAIEASGCVVTFVDRTKFNFPEVGGTVILPSTLTSLYSIASVISSDSVKLSTLKIKSTAPPVLSYSSTSNMPAKIIVPAGTLQTYQTAEKWNVYADIMEEATE